LGFFIAQYDDKCIALIKQMCSKQHWLLFVAFDHDDTYILQFKNVNRFAMFRTTIKEIPISSIHGNWV
jgi:hypothetical protein